MGPPVEGPAGKDWVEGPGGGRPGYPPPPRVGQTMSQRGYSWLCLKEDTADYVSRRTQVPPPPPPRVGQTEYVSMRTWLTMSQGGRGHRYAPPPTELDKLCLKETWLTMSQEEMGTHCQSWTDYVSRRTQVPPPPPRVGPDWLCPQRGHSYVSKMTLLCLKEDMGTPPPMADYVSMRTHSPPPPHTHTELDISHDWQVGVSFEKNEFYLFIGLSYAYTKDLFLVRTLNLIFLLFHEIRRISVWNLHEIQPES